MEKQSENLIVDDNPENLKVLNDLLSKDGYVVRIAGDGQSALTNNTVIGCIL